TPLRFPGQYFDPETRLNYNLHRYYDPESARYTSPDPWGLAAAPNHYSYVDNPHSWCDPLGLSPHSYSEIKPNGQRGPAYAEVSPQTLLDAKAGLIGSAPGRGRRWAPPGFITGKHSRGHLIGQQFGGEGRDMRNIVAQDLVKNNGEMSEAEGKIADHVRQSGRTVIVSSTPLYHNGGDVPSHIRLEAVDDFGWSFDRLIDNF
ncbi:MAG: DNA/RNA non-specific endonuclease, partial [Kitasatospora sp.]|nr:DNA/RNA non-specific endonuclease [Kitasatospora sp.]